MSHCYNGNIVGSEFRFPSGDPYGKCIVADRHYTFTPTTFTKRQVRPSEYLYRDDGTVAKSRFERERLVNERDALLFLAENSSIPVPRVLEWSDIDGVGSLTVARISGDTFDAVYDSLEPSDQAKLERNTLSYIEETVVPQLQSLRSTKMGQLAGIVFPPVRVISQDERPRWEARTSTESRYVYCHNDLAGHNIMVDPATLTVNAIVDWEYSGFFPKEMEFPFWKVDRNESYDEEHCNKMIELLDAPGDPPVAQQPWTVSDFSFKSLWLMLSWIKIRSSHILSVIFSSLGFPNAFRA